MMGFGMIWGWLGMLLFWASLIVLAIWLVGLLFPTAKKPGDQQIAPPSAQEILDSRYARGELTQEQYQLMSQTIQKS